MLNLITFLVSLNRCQMTKNTNVPGSITAVYCQKVCQNAELINYNDTTCNLQIICFVEMHNATFLIELVWNNLWTPLFQLIPNETDLVAKGDSWIIWSREFFSKSEENFIFLKIEKHKLNKRWNYAVACII